MAVQVLTEATEKLDTLDDNEKGELIYRTLEKMPESKRASALRGAASRTGTPFQGASQWVVDTLWISTMGLLVVVIIGGMILGLSSTGSDETAVFGFVGIALGAVIGILVPSPRNSKG